MTESNRHQDNDQNFREDDAQWSLIQGRAMLVTGWGPESQRRLRNLQAVVVGAGGLGTPAVLYLAGAGVGHVVVADDDIVSAGNLHRQVAFGVEDVRNAVHKAEALATAARALQCGGKVTAHTQRIGPANVRTLVESASVVIDASDNVATRYLLGDICARMRIPLVSAAALGAYGQISVYSLGEDGACYRCVHPKPPPLACVSSCAEGGVLGPVPAVMGSMLAMEAMKVLGQAGTPLSGRMLLYDALGGSARVVNLRRRRDNCEACGNQASEMLPMYDVLVYGNGFEPEPVPNSYEFEVSAEEVAGKLHTAGSAAVLVDVREKLQHAIGSPREALHIPMESILACSDCSDPLLDQLRQADTIFLLCRRGIRSAAAADHLRSLGLSAFSIRGGVRSWTLSVDSTFPGLY